MSSTALALAGVTLVVFACAAGAQAPAPTTLTLGDAARRAAEHGASTEAARARSSRADARAAQRRADFLPSLSGAVQAGARTWNSASLGIELPAPTGGSSPFDPRGEVLGPVHTVDMRTQVRQRVLDLPSLYRWRAASADADAAHHAADVTADASATRGATAYLRVLRAEASIRAREADSTLAAELADIARRQLQSGVGIALDVTRAESRLAAVRARLISTRGARDRAMLELRDELAIPFDAPLALADSLEPPAVEAVPLQADAIAAALQRRPDIRAAEAEGQSARLGTRAARLSRLPVISLYADQGRTGGGTDRLLGTYSYGVQVSMPVFDGMRAHAERAEESARTREADAELRDARRRIETEVRAAFVALDAAREEVAAARVRLGLAEQEVSQARERHRNGLSNNADVITASIALNGARDEMIEALAAYHQSRVALAAAEGGVTHLP